MAGKLFWLLAILALAGLANCEEKALDGTGPTCPMGTCTQAHRAKLIGANFDYFPQVRKFMEVLPSYPDVYREEILSAHPELHFLDKDGETLQVVDLQGMWAHEMEEELTNRGIVKKA